MNDFFFFGIQFAVKLSESLGRSKLAQVVKLLICSGVRGRAAFRSQQGYDTSLMILRDFLRSYHVSSGECLSVFKLPQASIYILFSALIQYSFFIIRYFNVTLSHWKRN